jgi:MazG family protein
MSSDSLTPLTRLLARLRGPDGCPWDRKQTLETVRAYLIEEAHEVAAAIDANDPNEVSAELGDLLFQLVFTAELAREAGGSTLPEIIERIRRKMIDRHPHVFGDATLADSSEVQQAWERRKASANAPGVSILDGVPGSVPALLGAYRMTQKASGVGFDWSEASEVLAKVHEELAEVEAELDGRDNDPGRVAEELGDLLFAIANLCRHLEVDPEWALAQTNRKFRRRFGHIEKQLEAAGKELGQTSLSELDRLWNEAKRNETTESG